MNRLLPTLLLLCACLPAGAADIVTTRYFSEKAGTDAQVLAHVEHKAVVAEYLDPTDTGIGKSMANMLWREVLSAISDQAGAGVILARPPGEERLVDLLQSDYHKAALRIAEHQQARMALWGIANEIDGQVFITSYLSLVEATRGDIISYKISRNRGGGERSGELELKLPRNKFNFPTVRRSRKALFQRPIMVAKAASLHAKPDRQSTRVSRLRQGEVVQSVDMESGWFKIQLRSGETGYLASSYADLAPLSVLVDRAGINLRREPVVRDDTVIYSGRVKGQYRVLEQRFTGNRLWYRLAFDGGKPAWVAASLTERVYSMPVVHFVAGMYRYFGERHEDTNREFQRFIDYPGEKRNNVNLSVAYQYQALSSVLAGKSARTSVQLLEKARKQTPLDATTYKLEALSWIGTPQETERVRASLEQARKLDPKITAFKLYQPLDRNLDREIIRAETIRPAERSN